MTVSAASNVKTYTGNNATVTFSTVFQFIAEGDIVVTLDGVVQTLTTHYTVTGGDGAVGSVVFVTAPGTGVAIVLQRIVAYEQDTDFADFNGTPADVTETQFDLIVMQTQQLNDATSRALTLAVGSSGVSAELPTPSAGLALKWNATADAIINSTYDPDTQQGAAAASASAAASSASAASSSASSASSSAATATAAALAAEAAVEENNLPAFSAGDATKIIKVSDTEDGYDYAGKLPDFTASKQGAIVVQNATDDGFDFLTTQGTSGHPLVSAGADADPAFGILGIAGGGTGQATASAGFDALKQTATTGATGVVELATDAEVATGTDTARVPPVSSMIYHQGVANVWVNFNGTGTPAARDSYNLTSITDSAVGTYVLNFSITLSNANYCGVTAFNYANTGVGNFNDGGCTLYNFGTTSVGVFTTDGASTAIDPEIIGVALFGDR